MGGGFGQLIRWFFFHIFVADCSFLTWITWYYHQASPHCSPQFLKYFIKMMSSMTSSTGHWGTSTGDLTYLWKVTIYSYLLCCIFKIYYFLNVQPSLLCCCCSVFVRVSDDEFVKSFLEIYRISKITVIHVCPCTGGLSRRQWRITCLKQKVVLLTPSLYILSSIN